MAAAKKSQNHVQVQEKVLNPYLETDTAAAWKNHNHVQVRKVLKLYLERNNAVTTLM